MTRAIKTAKKVAKTAAAIAAVAIASAGNIVPQGVMLHYRSYQQPVVFDHSTKTAVIHWSRQIGKSHTLAGWAVHRLTKQLQTHDSWLVTVLSNSRANGGEFVMKVHDVCRKLGQAFVEDGNRDQLEAMQNVSEDAKLELMRFEVRLEIGGKIGRIIVLAANPRTARGFSGDLILDEFAFHQDSRAIWDAAEPIISANPEFLCRISSTGNGRRNMFYQLIAEGRIPYYKVRRSDAWKTGELKIYSLIDGKEITPDEARAQASDKRSYDQNYECEFNDEATTLLTPDLINLAERALVSIDEQSWSTAAISRMLAAKGDLYFGNDVARTRDFSFLPVIERDGNSKNTIAALRMQDMRLPSQLVQVAVVLGMPKFRGGCFDMTGLGLGLFEFAQEWLLENHPERVEWIQGVNFASTEPTSLALQLNGAKAPTARVTELMATDLLAEFEARSLAIPIDAKQRDDLMKPEKLVSPNGRVSIAATRDEAGHADHFWGYALAVRAIHKIQATVGYSSTLC